MSLRLCILGSGSGGNAAVVRSPGTCLLIDAGLSLRALSSRLAVRNLSMDDIDALLVTHTHVDHLRSSAITACLNHRIPMYNHVANEAIFARKYRRFHKLAERRLNATFDDAPLIMNDLTIRALRVPHDADGVTLALSIEHDDGEHRLRIAFATDLGRVPHALIDLFADSDVLVLEFNHDIDMLRNSSRTQYLKSRVNGASGHLSNAQAAAALRTLIARSTRPPLAVVPAHLSRECNTPRLVTDLVRGILHKQDAGDTHLILTSQDEPTEWLDIAAMHKRNLKGLV